jgi:TonB family protein
MRILVGFVPVLAVLAQTAQPIPPYTPVPPVRPEPIPTQIPTPYSSRLPKIGPAAVPVRKVAAKYTPEARAAGLQGTVSLYVEVDRTGKPSEVQVMEGLGLGLDEEAVKALKHWEFEPKPDTADEVQDALEIDVPFQLDPPGPWLVESEHYRFTIPDRERHGDVVRPVPIRYVAPDAAACREAGTVAVSLTVGIHGIPGGVSAVEGGPSVLADAAVKAAESWQFKPASNNGKNIEAQGGFRLECRPEGAVAKTPAVSEQKYRVGGGVSAPVLISKAEPEYTERARQAKRQGTSMLYVQISPEGKATHIHVFRRLGLGLDQKAIEAVKRWHFKPGMKDGKPVTVEATIEVNFRLL